MSSLNMGSVMGKIQGYASSSKGKAAMQKRADDIIRKGLHSGKIKNEAELFAAMQSDANRMIAELRGVAASYGLPESVMAHFDSLTASAPRKTATGYAIDISFADGLGRPSLYPEGYPEGVRNIVALFNNGYTAKYHVEGEWRGQIFKSKLSRQGLHFMNAAVESFTPSAGSDFSVDVVLSGEYK